MSRVNFEMKLTTLLGVRSSNLKPTPLQFFHRVISQAWQHLFRWTTLLFCVVPNVSLKYKISFKKE
ncbi:hypothetical protein CBL_03397 [Carabus blaptoides fortunei]